MKPPTSVLAILGHPVAHSRSPAMHNAAIRALGLDAVYVPFDVPPERLSDAVRGLRALGVAGANVTLPLKAQVMGFLDHIDPDARAIGAVNTIVREGDRLIGENTDAPGLVRSLEEAGIPIRVARVVVLGAGGAARAAVVGLARAGASRIAVAARRAEQANDLVGDLRRVLETPLEAIAMSALGTAFEETTLVVQSTSATLEGNPEAAAFAESLPLEALPKSAAVVDLVYAPRETTVLKRASERGLKTVDGLGMLLHQGALAFERWLGIAPPLEEMRKALE